MESIVSSPAAHFVWKVTGDPVQIGISLDIVRRIREYLAPDSNLRRGQDKGGLLLGNSSSQGVQIDNFVPLLADENGLRYVHPRFGPRDLTSYIEELNFLAGPAAVVGYFRGDFGKGVRLFETDLAFIEKYFTDRSNVFLVISSTGGTPPSAGFFSGKTVKFSPPILCGSSHSMRGYWALRTSRCLRPQQPHRFSPA